MMTFSEKNKLAHSLGAFYENGYWRFPSVAAKESFECQVAGLEQQKAGQGALAKSQEAE